jgi:phenylacetate-CoA ligase
MSNFPEGITAEGMDRRKWKYVATSGTTRQIMGIHDFKKTNVNWAAGLRSHKLAGDHDVGKKWMEIPPHMCTNICGIDDSGEKAGLFSKEMFSLLFRGNLRALWQHVYDYFHGRRHNIYRRITLPSFGSQGTNLPEQDIQAYIDEISAYQPYLLEGLPLYLYTIAKHLVRESIPAPRVGVIKPFGGSMTQKMKEVIRRGFGCDVFDTYGCSETGFIASDCEKHEGLHLFMDLYHVEVCRNGELVAPGELGKLYITDLTNRAMPWIRYDIGDVGRYFVDDHGCGRKSTRIQVEGRVQDALCNQKGDFFTSDQIFDFFHSFTEIDNFQLIEKSRGDLDLLVVPNNGARVDQEGIGEEFRRFFDMNASVKTYVVKTIKAEDGGKFRFVKSKSFDPIDESPVR